MSPQTYERKLTAILSADVAGYSRLMGEDEDLTIKTLTGHREMMTALIEKHKGRVVDSPGNNLLSTFPSVTQAVDCAVEIQREMADYTAHFNTPLFHRELYWLAIKRTRFYGNDAFHSF